MALPILLGRCEETKIAFYSSTDRGYTLGFSIPAALLAFVVSHLLPGIHPTYSLPFFPLDCLLDANVP